VKDGRFGLYVTDGITNRTLPKGVTAQSLTHQEAVELLAAKRAAGPAPKRSGGRSSSGGPARGRTKAPTKR